MRDFVPVRTFLCRILSEASDSYLARYFTREAAGRIAAGR